MYGVFYAPVHAREYFARTGANESGMARSTAIDVNGCCCWCCPFPFFALRIVEDRLMLSRRHEHIYHGSEAATKKKVQLIRNDATINSRP